MLPLLATGLACTRTGGDLPLPGLGPLPIEAGLVWSERVPTVAVATWPAPEGASSWVEYGLDGALDQRTPATDAPEPALAVLGLKAGRSYAWRAVSEADGARWESPPETIEVPAAPETLPALTVRAEPASEMAHGYVLASIIASDLRDPPYVAIYDGEGDPVWWWALPEGHTTISPSFGLDPGTVLWDRYDLLGAAVAQQARLDGGDLREVPLPGGHHAVIEPLPGTLAWPAHDLRPDGDGWINADRVQESDLASLSGGAPPRTVISLYDAVFDGAFEPPCEHAETPRRYGTTFPVYEWSHLNSLVYLPDRDAYLLHARWIDAVLLVDRPSGELLWQLGGPGGTFALPDGSDPYGDPEQSLLSHAHLSDAWDGGLLAFDNGTHRDPAVSSIVELAWDEQTRTVEEVLRWTDPEGRYANILGDARRLPGGGILASWSTLGEITELSPDGSPVWTASTAPHAPLGRIAFARDLYTTP